MLHVKLPHDYRSICIGVADEDGDNIHTKQRAIGQLPEQVMKSLMTDDSLSKFVSIWHSIVPP